MRILIQTVEGKITHDFSFFLLESIRFQNWRFQTNDFKVLYSEKPDVPNCMPVGSIEFVCAYLQAFHGKSPLPRNVPESLFPFANRRIFNGTDADVTVNQFVKSNDRMKGFTEPITEPTMIPPGNYQISDLVDIQSEYRCFVHRGQLLSAKHYSGDFRIFPNFERVDQMIAAFTDAPIAYTLDVAINDTGTFVIEVHDFFSCGLYGFNDSNLVYLFTQWFNQYIRQ